MIVKTPTAQASEILTPEALAFINELQNRFGSTRDQLLAVREETQKLWDKGVFPTFPVETESVRAGNWQVAPCPKELEIRHVEITGPTEPKMMIHALNSGADAFMADLEDSLSPTWDNVIQGQVALKKAVRKDLEFTSTDGKHYKMQPKTAQLLVRPRGWHLLEKNLELDGRAVSASLFDFGLYFFHNAIELSKNKTGIYFYLPKLESYQEAKLWNDVFLFAEQKFKLATGFIRATVLIETLPAVFQMDEILFELKEHICGLNAGRWDYIFSLIKKMKSHSSALLPDRRFVTMATPPMQAYAELLVKTCHKRGAHAMGGMSAFVPSRKDPEVTERALQKVREDKLREVRLGFDGTWVAHPDLVALAKEIFVTGLEGAPNQKSKSRSDLVVDEKSLLDFKSIEGQITEEGVRTNIHVALQYLERWLSGVGAVAIHHLMEDAATAEISRAQLWQWMHHAAKLDNGIPMSRELYLKLSSEEFDRLKTQSASQNLGTTLSQYKKSKDLLDHLVLDDKFENFLTVPAYQEIH